MHGGYHRPTDIRPLLQRLATDTDVRPVWNELWNELHHQGDVGEASYAAVPHLVRIHRLRDLLDWNTYALVATIEVARDSTGNPPLPDWLRTGYTAALRQLGETSLVDLPRFTNPETVRALLAIVALWKGARTYGRMLIEFTEDEVLELEAQAFGERD